VYPTRWLGSKRAGDVRRVHRMAGTQRSLRIKSRERPQCS
jgi:hypothetical protein